MRAYFLRRLLLVPPTLLGITLIVFKGRDHSVPLAFGPYLAIAGAIALFFGQTLVKTYYP